MASTQSQRRAGRTRGGLLTPHPASGTNLLHALMLLVALLSVLSHAPTVATGAPLPPVAPDTTFPSLEALDAAAVAATVEDSLSRTHGASSGESAWQRMRRQAQESLASPPPLTSAASVHKDYAYYSQYFTRQKKVQEGGRAETTESQDGDGAVDEPALVAATPTLCSARSGCPRSSMVWASGSFTFPELLTPTTFLQEANATLQLSLCCDYLYNGKMLRDPELYHVFLTELLQASPFQVLSAEEKEQLFPRKKAFIVDEKQKRVYNWETVLTDRDITKRNDGDGDVLVLVTGKLDVSAVSRVYVTAAASPLYVMPEESAETTDEVSPPSQRRSTEASTGANKDALYRNSSTAAFLDDVRPFLSGRSGLGQRQGRPASREASAPSRDRRDSGAQEERGGPNVLSTDMQLRITNRVLKCKCPHTLLVMPLLKLRSDRLPPIEILGVGPHCGKRPTRVALTPSEQQAGKALLTPFRHIVQIADQDSDATGQERDGSLGKDSRPPKFATTFLVAPALMPGTTVTWTVRRLTKAPPSAAHRSDKDDGAATRGDIVLQHTQVLLPRVVTDKETGKESLLQSHAPSPYVVVEPHVKYHIHVRAERVGGRLAEESSGLFVLRMPFHRAWPLPPVDVKPHFGFDRQLRLNLSTTLSHPEVAEALSPKRGYPADLAEAARFDYYGFFENAPLDDQPIPQRYVFKRYNPFAASPAGTKLESLPAISFPLFFGKNLLSYAIRDVDDVCDPVELEEREYWAVQSIILTENPVTACGPTQDLEALLVRHLLHTMRQRKGFAVNVRETSWARLPEPEAGREGQYTCRRRKWAKSVAAAAKAKPGATGGASAIQRPPVVYDGTCDATTLMFPGGISGVTARLHLARRGVYDVVWVVDVEVADKALIIPDNLDAAYTEVLPTTKRILKGQPTTAVTEADNEGGDATAVETAHVLVHSRTHYVVRRVASYPTQVPLQLPMHARRFMVAPPSPLPPTDATGSARASASEHEVHPSGYWVTHSPLRTRSVDERLNLELDTNNVPNVQQTLPNSTLLYIAQDLGEDLSLAYGIPYTSRCPDTVVEYVVNVVAMHAPPVVPAFVPIYTEEDCVVLEPPRLARKDEVVEWFVKDCPEAQRPPHIVERVVAFHKDHDTNQRDGDALGGEIPVAKDLNTISADEVPVVVVLACGIEVYKRCEVDWTATNLVATVRKTYSLRRCQRPPEVLFHKNGLQLKQSIPSPLFALPSVQETYYADGASEASRGLEKASNDVRQERTRPRSIIPVAGYAAEVGYSFNYTAGPQNHFEASMQPIPEEGANQLLHTQTHSPYKVSLHHQDPAGAVSSIVWRRRALYDVATTTTTSAGSTHRSPSSFTEGKKEEDNSWAAPHGGGYGEEQDAYDRERDRLFRGGSGSSSGGADAMFSFHDDDDMDVEELLSMLSFGSAAAPSPGLAGAHDAKQTAASTSRGLSADDPFTRWQAARLERLLRRRDRAIDAAINTHFLMMHSVNRRELAFDHLGNSSLYPIDYVVRPATKNLPSTAALEEDRAEFQRRNMCVAREGRTALLAVSPLGVVTVDARKHLPPPPPPAVAILPFCTPQLIFSRHPHLHHVYGYDFTWECEDNSVIATEKKEPTYSLLTHVGENSGKPLASLRNETNCRLTVKNDITDTARADWFLVRRVFPSPPPFEHFVILSDNAASLPGERKEPRDTSGAATASARHGKRAPVVSGSPRQSSSLSSSALLHMSTRRLYGKSVVLHADSPSNPRSSHWRVLSLVPAIADSRGVGTQVLMDHVRFTPLPRHPGAIARGKGGSTVLVKGLDTPGIYTIAHAMPDPGYPSLCPNVTLVETLEVLHAQVREKELYICGATAALRAVPIPKELQSEFMGTWEVISLQTAEEEVWTSGVNFTGIRFEHGKRPDTLVHGLPFGIVTIRWAIYKILSDEGAARRSRTSDGRQPHHDFLKETSERTTPHRILVDYDTVRVMVLTENLHTHRLVTLADAADVLTTSSTQDWRIAAEYYAADLDHLNAGISGRADASHGGGGSRSPILHHQPLLNYSHLSFGGDALFGEFNADGTLSATVMDPVLFPYYGPTPRPGASLLTVSRLSVGSVHLGYTLRPSVNMFGAMLGHTCELPGIFEIERVSAFLSAETTLDHECDGYTGEGEITLCLHAKAATPITKAQEQAQRGAQKGKVNGKNAESALAAAKTSARENAWESRLRLVDAAHFEDVVKRGALEVERKGCSTPWWVWPTTRWHHVRPVDHPAISTPGRCIAFAVTAGRHLAPREVSHPLFLATPTQTIGGGTAPQPYLGLPQGSNGGSRRRGGDAGLSPNGVCGFGDFITSRVIDGAANAGPSVHSKGTSAAGGSGGGGFFSRFSRGLRGAEDGTDTGRYGGVQHLPVLHKGTLKRHTGVGMRPMMGQQGLADEVTLETNVSHGNESIVTLRLDITQPRQLGGYVTHTAQEATDASAFASSSSSSPFSRVEAPFLHISRMSLLLACVEGSVRAGDVMQYWTETNRPDGALDRTADEWIEYVQAVKDTRVPCEVLFVSLQHLLAKARRAAAAAAGANSLALPGSAGADPAMEDEEDALSAAASLRRRGATPVTDFASLDRTAGGVPRDILSTSQQQRLVPLEVVERQLESLQREHTRTQDGIDVTGLRSDLQDALNRRRVTKAQLKEIEEARRLRTAQTTHHEQSLLGVAPSNSNHVSGDSAQQRQQQQPPLNALSQKERLLEALKLYKRVAAAGGENREVVAAIRIRLPRYDPFVVPYTLFLRTALHKDVICGTNITAWQDLRSPRVAIPAPNPYSTVAMGRVEILDLPAAITPYPPTVKQCEVEGNMPVLSLNVSGARYAAEAFPASSVFLEEVPNPDLPDAFRSVARAQADAANAVGLTPCMADLTDGMDVVVAHATRKHLHLHLNSCPAFRMLAPEEYNEHQDTEELLQRLQYPRLLKVTIKNALKPDSFTSRTGAVPPVTPTHVVLHHDSGGKANENGTPHAMSVAPQQPDHRLRDPLSYYSTQHTSLRELRTSLDVSFIVKVVPTIALLHLRDGKRTSTPSMPSRNLGLGFASNAFLRDGFRANALRPLVLCERDMRRDGFELGVELLGDYWTTPVGEIRADDGATSTHDAPARDGGFQQQYQHSRERAAANVALLNSFSIVEHYTLESAHHLFLKGAGVYRSHFVNYLFSAVLGDANVLQNHRFVRRYNSTFVSVAVPPQPLSARQRSSTSGGASHAQQLSSLWGEQLDADATEGMMGVTELEDMYIHSGNRADSANGAVPVRSYLGAAGASRGGTDEPAQSFQLPAVRRFSRIEEILFAVPGIATECRGCLLADTTFFVAGDLTGLWSFPGYYSGPSASAPSAKKPAASTGATAVRRRTTLAAGGPQLPTALPPLENAVLTRPLVLPWHEASVIPRGWQFHWMCPSAAHSALNAFYHAWESTQAGLRDGQRQHHGRGRDATGPSSSVVGLGDATLHMEVVLYAARDTLGGDLPTAKRPVSLLRSEDVSLSKALSSAASAFASVTGAGGKSLAFKVKEAAAEAAYTTVAADYLRQRRPGAGAGAVGLAPVFAYHREDRLAGGLMAVNASVFVKLCVPLPTQRTRSDAGVTGTAATSTASSCMVVSVTDSLITVEAPKTPRAPNVFWTLVRKLLGLESSATQTRTLLDGVTEEDDGSLYYYLSGKHANRATAFTVAPLVFHLLLATVFYLVLPLLSVEAARQSTRGRRGHGGGSLRDVDASRVRASFTLSGLLAGSGFVDEGDLGAEDGVDLSREAAAYEARVAFSAMFLVLLVFTYAYVPVVWLAVVFTLWSYILYKAKDGLVLLLFTAFVVYWRFFM